MRSDEETQEMPDWAKDMKPPIPIDEDMRQELILLEIKRQQDAYYRDNPPQTSKRIESNDQT